MRQWEVIITDPTKLVNGKPKLIKSWSSQNANGSNNNQALQIEMDVAVYFGSAGDMKSSLFLYGVSLDDLKQSHNFKSLAIEVRGGMSKGLPLATPSQYGTLFTGFIWEVYGNWVGTDMELGFAIMPTEYTADKPGAFTFRWAKGQTLATALGNTLSIALPGYKQNITISPSLVAPATHHGHYRTLGELADTVTQFTKLNFAGTSQNYPGVLIGVFNGSVIVTDGTTSQSALQIDFTDFIGQPTWVEVDTLQFQAVMRSDIGLGRFVQMPRFLSNAATKLGKQGANNIPGFITQSAAAMPSQVRYLSTFSGPFLVKSLRQVGNSRSASGEGWVTVVSCLPNA
jgi:hypothetical protein